MAYVTPNTTIYLLSDIQIDKNYNNTVRFDSTGDQQDYFSEKIKYSFNSQSYQRVNKNTLRIEKKYDDIYYCNYLMFKNDSPYNNKWYYAFIDSCEYINENCSEITYTIDVIQTYWFDFEFEDCIVEREHTATDNKYEHIMPEQFDGLEYCVLGMDKHSIIDSSDPNHFMILVIYPSGLGRVRIDYNHQYHQNNVWFQAVYSFHDYISLDPNTKSDYMNDGSVINGYVQGYNIVPIEVYVGDDNLTGAIEVGSEYARVQDTQSHWAQYLVSSAIRCIVRAGALTTGKVIKIIQVPIGFYNANTAILKPIDYETDTADASILITEKTDFTFKTDTYTPRNNKLYNYPFQYLEVSNTTGNKGIFKWEDFYVPHNIGKANFDFFSMSVPSPSMICVPCYYEGIRRNFQNTISFDAFTETMWSENSFTRWLSDNWIRVASSVIATAVTKAPVASDLSAQRAEISNYYNDKRSNYMSRVSRGKKIGYSMYDINMREKEENNRLSGRELKEGYSTIHEIFSQNLLSALPITSTEQGNSAIDVNCRIQRQQFEFYHMAIKPEIARRIDSFFDRFGYAINQMKKPNVKGGLGTNESLRPKWNYIKTIYAKIHPAQNTGFTQEDEENIETIFNKGITFWESSATIGDYTATNTPVVPNTPSQS